MADSGSRIIENDEFTADDRSALAWAASTEHPVAVAIVGRVRSGADANASVAELAAIRQDWEAADRPPPKPHVHRTPARFADGTTVIGVRFLGDDPYVREDAPGLGLYLDERWAPPCLTNTSTGQISVFPKISPRYVEPSLTFSTAPARVSGSRSDVSAATVEPEPHSLASPS